MIGCFFGHSLNEMGVSEANSWIQELNPEFVSFIEPGTPRLLNRFFP